MSKTYTKNDIVKLIKMANKRIRILGVVALDLNWCEIRDDLFEKINSGIVTVEVICEADHFVRMQSLISSDTRFSGESRPYEMGTFNNILQRPLHDLYKYLKDHNCKNMEPTGPKQCFSLRTSYIYIPIPAINIDDEYYYTFPLTKFNNVDKYEKFEEENPWYCEFQKYFVGYFDSLYGVRKYSTEYTEKGNRLEVIPWYDEISNEKTHYSSRKLVGLLPRDSFPNTPLNKLVVWGLIFTRDGRLLIHQRGKNAKDNQGMWDKSVGGHVDLLDIDTPKAIAREVGEELYKIEKEDQGGHDDISFIGIDPDKMIFLGEWKPNRRYVLPFADINDHQGDFLYFRFAYDFSTTPKPSPRYMPNGEIVRINAFSDVFVCVTPKDFDTATLKNSKFKIVELYELKNMYNTRECLNENNVKEEFVVSPDLESIINSSMWDQLTSFSDYIKENIN